MKQFVFFIKKIIFPKLHSQVSEIFKSIDMHDLGSYHSKFYLLLLWELLEYALAIIRPCYRYALSSTRLSASNARWIMSVWHVVVELSWLLFKHKFLNFVSLTFSKIKVLRIFRIFNEFQVLIILRQVIPICNFAIKIFLITIIYLLNPHNQGNNHMKL